MKSTYTTFSAQAVIADSGQSFGIPAIITRLCDSSLSLDVRAALLRGSVSEPLRSQILVSETERDDSAIIQAQIARVTWVLGSLSHLYPAVASACGVLSFDSLDQANQRLSDVINISDDVATVVTVLKHYLTWHLQLTEDFFAAGIDASEVPGVLSTFESIRDLNRAFAKKVSSDDYRARTSPGTRQADVRVHEAQVNALHSPLTLVLSINSSSVPAAVLRKFLDKTGSLLSSSHRKAATHALKRELIPKARVAMATNSNFVLKDYMTIAG